MYNFTLPPPVQPISPLAGFTGGLTNSLGSVQQMQGQGMKNALMQEEITQRKDLKNALTDYGKTGSTDMQGLIQKVMPIKPELAIQLQTIMRTGRKDQIDMLVSGAKLTEAMGPAIMGNFQGYQDQFHPMMTQIGIPLRDPKSFIGPDGQVNQADYNQYVQTLVAGKEIIKEAAKPETFGHGNLNIGGGQVQSALYGNKGTVRPIPGAIGSANTPQLFVDKDNPENKQWISPGQPVGPNMVPEKEQAQLANELALTPDAINQMANRYLIDGTMPGLGLGKAATKARSEVMNKVAEIMKNQNMGTNDPVVAKNIMAGLKTEMGQLMGQRGKVLAFAETADRNIEQALELSRKVDRSGVPVFNRWILAGREKLAGDPDVSAFHAATQVAINEIAKVTSTATGGGVTSDSARQEIASMLNTAQTPEQFLAVVKTLRNDLTNRKAGYDTQLKSIQDSMSKVGKVAGVDTEPQKTNIPQPKLQEFYQANKAKIDRLPPGPAKDAKIQELNDAARKAGLQL